MENEHISSLFQKIRARLAKSTVNTGEVSQIVFEETRIRLQDNDIVFKKGVITLKLNPLKKSEFNIKKTKILERVRRETGIDVSDIR